MVKEYRFPLSEKNPDHIERNVDELNDLLGKSGFSFFIDEHSLCIKVDQETCKRHLYRNAGKPVAKLSSVYTCGEIRKLRETMSVEEIAQYLGVSRTTFFRIWNDNLDRKDTDIFLNMKGKQNRTSKKI